MNRPPSRREFLALAGAAAMTVSARSLASPQPASAPPAGKRTLRKAIMFGMCAEDGNLRDKFQIIRDCGFDGVEMDSPSSIPVDDILAAQDATGLIVHGVVDSSHWKHHLNHP